MTDDGSKTLTIEQALRIALAAQREGRVEQAASIHAQILARDPENGDALHLLGTLEIDRGNLAEAERLLRRVVACYPSVSAFRASLAKALHRLGRADEAIGHAAQALAGDPGNPGIREVANQILRVEPSLELLRLPSSIQPVEARPAPAPDDSLVLGLATGYRTAALKPFVRSLREHYQGPVHLIVDNDAETLAFLAGHDISTGLAKDRAAHPVINRFAEYRDFIETIDEGTRILLTDVSDVVFQGNPFAFSVRGNGRAGAEPGFIAVLEDVSQSLGSCPWNSDWLRVHFGTRMLQRLGDRRISCIGTIFGDRDGLLDYLNRFCLLAASLPVPGVYGLDTAIHNVLLHHEMTRESVALENGWPVATVQHMTESAIAVRGEKIRLEDERLPLVVHQYNRRAAMLAHVERRHAGG